jgi:CheY-like chemotaxis protein
MASVLVIDDDEQIRTFVRTVLEKEGFVVHEADNGARGLASYRQLLPDVVLCDIFMPEKEGLETILNLCRQSPGVKIVAMSGGSSVTRPTEFLPLAERFGAVAALEKPFGKGVLLQTVREAIHGSGSDGRPA